MNIIEDLKHMDAAVLIDVRYHKSTYENDWKDSLDIIFCDSNREKKIYHVEEPTIEIFFAKDDAKETSFNRTFIKQEDTYSKEVSYDKIAFEIADEAGEFYKKFARKCIQDKQRKRLRELHKYENVFGSDYQIVNLIRIWWMLEIHDDKYIKLQTPRKGFLDIEVDGIDFPGFVVGGVAPINAVTLIDDASDQTTSYTFVLRNPRNPQIQELENDIGGFIQELHGDFDETYGDIDYQFFFYDEDDEITMIQHMFVLINTLDIDFWLIWNMSFDIPYIIDRIEQLGRDPRDIMCDKDFPMKEAYFYKDKINFKLGGKTDYAAISTKSVFYDQMILYAAVRSSQSEMSSYKLTDIAAAEIDDKKLDYSEVENFKTFPYENFRLFLKYNIKDVLLQIGIERKVTDVDNLYKRSYQNATQYNKAFKQTVFLSNRAYIEYWKQGLVIGNNINFSSEPWEQGSMTVKTDKDTEEESYAGGLVADPELIDYVGVEIMGSKSKYILKYVIDMDKQNCPIMS